MTDLDKLESIRKYILKLIETKTESNSQYLLGLHKATLIVDEHIISNLKGEKK